MLYSRFLVGFLFYIEYRVHVNPKVLICPSPLPFPFGICLFSQSVSLFLF